MDQKIFCCNLCQWVFCLFSSKNLIVSGHKCMPLFHFIFVCSVRECSSFIFLQVTVKFSQHHLLKTLSFLQCLFLPFLTSISKEMATHSSVLDWRIPGTGEPGGLPSMGSHRVRHDWSGLAAAAAAVDHKCVGLLLECLSGSIDLCVCVCDSTALFELP